MVPDLNKKEEDFWARFDLFAHLYEKGENRVLDKMDCFYRQSVGKRGSSKWIKKCREAIRKAGKKDKIRLGRKKRVAKKDRLR